MTPHLPLHHEFDIIILLRLPDHTRSPHSITDSSNHERINEPFIIITSHTICLLIFLLFIMASNETVSSHYVMSFMFLLLSGVYQSHGALRRRREINRHVFFTFVLPSYYCI